MERPTIKDKADTVLSFHSPSFSMNVGLLSGTTVILALFALRICTAAKWILFGRRKLGNYDWGGSSYCQRWQLFLSIEASEGDVAVDMEFSRCSPKLILSSSVSAH